MNNYITGYALALYSLAEEEGKLSVFKEDSSNLLIAFEENREIISLMNSQEIAIKEKYLIIEKLNVDIIIKNFLSLLAKKNKFNKSISTLKKLIKLINKELDIVEGIVYTNYELDNKVLHKMEAKVSKDLKLKVTLSNKVDKGIKAGFIIKVNDFVIEDTIESRIVQIKNELLKGEL